VLSTGICSVELSSILNTTVLFSNVIVPFIFQSPSFLISNFATFPLIVADAFSKVVIPSIE